MDDFSPVPRRRIYKICLTGGPCSGKTTALTTLREKFSTEFAVLCVPEVATMTFSSGVNINPVETSDDGIAELARAFCQAQIDLERYYETIASIQKKPVLLIADRGVVDNFAYCSPELKESVMSNSGWSMNYLRNERYDLVIHMVTAAFGADKFYTLENNNARQETREQAVELDVLMRREWLGHPNYVIIDNSVEGFGPKIDRVTKAVSNLVQLPVPTFVHKSLLLRSYEAKDMPAEFKFEAFRDEIVYLVNPEPDTMNWVVKRTYKNSLYPIFISVSRKISDNPAHRIETRKPLTEKVYLDYKSKSDLTKQPVIKNIIAFYFEQQHNILYYFIENIEVIDKKLTILRVFRDDNEISDIFVPGFLEKGEDVTNDPAYNTFNLARRA